MALNPIPPVKDRLAYSLIELLETKQLQCISVAEISKNASASLRSFYNYYEDKYALMGHIYEELTEHLWWDSSGKLIPLQKFFDACWNTERDSIMMTRFKNTLAYHGQNDVREKIEQKGIEDLQRLLRVNGYPGPYDDELRNILQFFMSGIVRIAELHFLNTNRFPSTWLADYGTKCIPSELAEYLLATPRKTSPK